MSRFLKTLAKVGLVQLEADELAAVREPAEPEPELDEATIERVLAEEEAQRPPPPPEAALGPRAEGAPAQGIEGRSLTEIYEGAQVPASPFPAEKLLRLLDGLRAMDPGTRKAAVLAMDAADEAWTIDDAVLDAERKSRALLQGTQRLDALVEQAETRAQDELAALDAYAQKAADTIRKQIAGLEQLLQQELQQAAEKKAQIQADLRSTREAASRERVRYEQEVARLREIPAMFAAAAEPPSNR